MLAPLFASRHAAIGGIAAAELEIPRQGIPLGHPLKPSSYKFVEKIAAGAIDKARKKRITKEKNIVVVVLVRGIRNRK